MIKMLFDRRIPRVAIATLCAILFAGLETGISQVQTKTLLHGLVDSSQRWYTAMDASDNHNFTVAVWKYSLSAHIYHPYIVRTTDGGITWNEQQIPLADIGDFRHKNVQIVCCIDSSNIFLFGASGM